MAFLASVFGRILLALIFIVSGVTKVMNVAQTQAFIDKAIALPADIALPVGIFELVFGVFLAIGFMTRISSVLLCGFKLATIVVFHSEVSEPAVLQAALRNLAIAGGLLMVFAYGQARGSLDIWRERDRARRAEIRAAKAQAREKGAREAEARLAAEPSGG
ncbi:DoxX family protein [Alteriqipengyuania lutimaris]|uniref:DoxX family protein n=1 Tax=Alteriqipengyuania lutimaris TaxID=1538146 RepID=A0A395LNE7_9SPHN|nr:DoxX family protein [Alteriqipengyuania lutimaris]MBB3034017.1 putative oxidoreductase [Alteriqipengyuania lutimaris]RDS77034.1 DoxX family protein [Alteriqipengyuania lutimaris]